METVGHPSVFIDPALAQAMRAVADDAEQLKRLHPTQLAIIRQQKWFQLFVPRLYKGLELSLPEGLQLEEGLAWVDGSVGWTVTLCSGAGWFAGFLDPQTAAAVFNNNEVCLAGSGKPSGTAKVATDGYEITGTWNYATGAVHATAFTANAVLEKDGNVLYNSDGSPQVQSFLFLRDEVTVNENWSSMGMIATGSHSFEVRGVAVKKNRAFIIDGHHAVLPHPIYQYPFVQFAETTLAVNISGMAVRFLDLCEVLLKGREEDTLHQALENAQARLKVARQLFYGNVRDSWEACITNLAIPAALLDSTSKASRRLANTAREVVDELWPCCGLRAADPHIEINRVWRNLHTASQHSLLNGY